VKRGRLWTKIRFVFAVLLLVYSPGAKRGRLWRMRFALLLLVVAIVARAVRGMNRDGKKKWRQKRKEANRLGEAV
jgi:hypothetical protein